MRLLNFTSQKIYFCIAVFMVTGMLVLGCAAPKQENLIKESESPAQNQKFSSQTVSTLTRQKIQTTGYVP
ncbi:MAG: hypothetical protein WBC96_03355, partial [Thermodesulfobacteriota bacterium]